MDWDYAVQYTGYKVPLPKFIRYCHGLRPPGTAMLYSTLGTGVPLLLTRGGGEEEEGEGEEGKKGGRDGGRGGGGSKEKKGGRRRGEFSLP